MPKYDVVIIGSGLGGLVCGTILSKEGYHVCVLEKNAVPGGCFQSFRRDGRILDTGIHYIGSMDKGEILRQYFTYFGIMDRLRILRMDEDAFDQIYYKGKSYSYAMGYDRFVETLARDFPEEREALAAYTRALQEIGALIHVDQLKQGRFSFGDITNFSLSAWNKIQSFTKNSCLQQVLGGTSMLYGGNPDSSTFYHHAMINNSYMRGAYRFIDGSMQVVDALIEEIRKNGGTVLTRAEATGLKLTGGQVEAVEINHKERIEARYVISSLHPAKMVDLLDKTPLIRKVYMSRMKSLANSYGFFGVYLLQKKGVTPYLNRNIYIHGKNSVWYAALHPEDTRIHTCMISLQASSANPRFTEVIYLLSPMYMNELQAWEQTTVGRRGKAYEDFKLRKTEELIHFAEPYFPGLMKNTEKVYTSTPLTYRDYTGTPEGSAYGIIKNYKSPLTTFVSIRTRINNLLLTGQNPSVHGALGVTLTAVRTCSELIGEEYLAKKIGEV